MSDQFFAEIIESSLHTWKAQTWQWNYFPQFGSLVCIEANNRTIFGIVHQIQTGSLDSTRYPFPYQKTEEELQREQPQIFEFLQTTFSCLTIGYLEAGTITYQLAPEPPKIHAFVGHATTEHYMQFFAQERYLHLIFGLSSHILNVDELLLALLKHLSSSNMLTAENLTKFIETLSLLNGNDYRRLKLFLQRVQPIITPQNQIR